MTSPLRMTLRCLAALLPLVLQATALAQGGPPMVTDDPDTPGDGHWEINLATITSRSAVRTEVIAPDADINYGVGEHLQLKVDVPWNFARDAGAPWKSGLGTAAAGVKWRFLDEDQAGFSLSTYPQVLSNWVASSRSRGVTLENRQVFLPIEGSFRLGDWHIDGEFGRAYISDDDDEWDRGVILAHDLGDRGEAMVEVHDSRSGEGRRRLFNVGMRWHLTSTLTALAAIGREAPTATPDRQQALVYLGVQWTRE